MLMAPRGKSRKLGPVTLFKGRQPGRPHYVPEWAKEHGYETQAELVEALGSDVDKSTVSRWYSTKNPSSPSRDMAARLAALFGHEDEPDCIFRQPGDDWLRRFFQNRSDEEIARIKQTLETAFPKRGTK